MLDLQVAHQVEGFVFYDLFKADCFQVEGDAELIELLTVKQLLLVESQVYCVGVSGVPPCLRLLLGPHESLQSLAHLHGTE